MTIRSHFTTIFPPVKGKMSYSHPSSPKPVSVIPALSSTTWAKDPHLPQLAETNPPQPMDVDGIRLFYDWIA
jgi:hypothetical protein